MISYESPYAGRGTTWFKGNIHAHTTASDGHLSPERLCEVYRQAGYDFLAVTDHNELTDTTAYSRPDFLTIPGVEIGYPDHVLHIGARSENSILDMTQLLHELQREPGLAIVAHPHWSNMSWDRIATANGYVGIEIYGYSPDINFSLLSFRQ